MNRPVRTDRGAKAETGVLSKHSREMGVSGCLTHSGYCKSGEKWLGCACFEEVADRICFGIDVRVRGEEEARMTPSLACATGKTLTLTETGQTGVSGARVWAAKLWSSRCWA